MTVRALPPPFLYHGTGVAFEAFASNERGIFFAERYEAAASYQRVRKTDTPRVLAAQVDIKNPWVQIRYGQDVPYSQQVDQSASALAARGYDGIHVPDQRAWVAFRPDQITILRHEVGAADFSHYLQAAVEHAAAEWGQPASYFEEGGCWGMALALRAALGHGSEFLLLADPTEKVPKDYTISLVHVSAIRAGDTVEIDGHLRTVCQADLRRGFMGSTLFGDSYRCGTVAVRRAEIQRATRVPSNAYQPPAEAPRERQRPFEDDSHRGAHLRNAYVCAGGKAYNWQGEADFTGGRVVTREQLVQEALANGLSMERLEADADRAAEIIDMARSLSLANDEWRETDNVVHQSSAPRG